MNEDYYETSDLGLTASLTASGFKLVGTDKSNPRRVVFLFDNNFDLQKTVEGYWTHELKLPAAILLEHIRILKTRIYG